ncbi:sensor histidine kinase [Pseudoteredinibacter isoporae]|uniref:sensor histidine kinase n=1 Tax=Pseudoteredinibacter isoporae TaxID=570281 RepID=UPI00310BE5BC
MTDLFLGKMINNKPLLLLRILCESIALLVICHVFIRPFLRLGILRWGLSISSIAAVFIYTIPIAIVLTLLMFAIGQTVVFSEFDIASIQFQSNSGEVSSRHMSTAAYMIVAGQNYIILLFWSALYLSWHFYRKRNELTRELEVTRLKQLANQINPHFMFNTLNSIRALVYSDQNKAAETITQLSELLRVHMHAEVEALSSLEQERELAENYLQIEHLRLGDRLQLKWDIEETLLQETIPSLIMLTLLENSVKYGVAPSRKGGWITITARELDSEHFCLQVTNSLPEKKVEQGNGIGLGNIRKRLELMYGERATMNVRSDDNFDVLLELPKK